MTAEKQPEGVVTERAGDAIDRLAFQLAGERQLEPR